MSSKTSLLNKREIKQLDAQIDLMRGVYEKRIRELEEENAVLRKLVAITEARIRTEIEKLKQEI